MTRTKTRTMRSAGLALALFAGGCAAVAEPLDLHAGHPAHPGTAGTVVESPAATPAPAAAPEPTRAPEPAPAPAPAPATIYACPMHPEVTSTEPGRCPKCGMHLRAAAAPADGGRR